MAGAVWAVEVMAGFCAWAVSVVVVTGPWAVEVMSEAVWSGCGRDWSDMAVAVWVVVAEAGAMWAVVVMAA